jgi:hypothetical protein
MKQRVFYLLVFVCFSVLISSAGHLKTNCKYTACMLKKKQEEKAMQKAVAAKSLGLLCPYSSVPSLW